jgi:DNA polymerase III subunit beta
MKLHCHRPTLAAALQVVGGVVPSRTPKDVLKNVKLQAAGGKVTLLGTDAEIGVRCEIPGVEIESEGETLLPAARTTAIIRELGEEKVDISVDSDAVWIKSQKSEFRLSAQDPGEFPPVAEFDEEQYYAIPAKSLRDAIKRTAFATDAESSRYALGGVLLELGGDKLTLAATDTRRLAVVEVACRSQKGNRPDGPGPVIPTKALTLIERIPDAAGADSDKTQDKDKGENAEVLLAVHPNEALVKVGNTTIYSRLVEGRFPKYRDVIPANPATSVELVVGPFYSAIRQAQIVTEEDSRGVDFRFASGVLTLTSKSADVGQSVIQLPISYDGPELAILFDPRFIAEFLRVLEPERSVRLDLIDAESAAVFRTQDAYTYVVMPLSRDR